MADDPHAVSALAPDYSRGWLERETPTSRVAEHLGVPIVGIGADLPDHDLLLLGSVGRGLTTLAAALAVSQFGAEPQLVTGHGSGISDVQWMEKVVNVRSWVVDEIPQPISALVGLLDSTDVPVLVDGVIAAAAVACASSGADVQAPVLGAEPVQKFLLDRANVPVWGIAGIGPGEGLGALSGLAMLRLALLARAQ
jgi:nicotinate-nucleotide--dimethylbenzimidazole phosphoribosyltransferase